MTREMARIIRTVKDPRVSGSLTAITACDVTADLKYAKVYFTFLDNVTGDEAVQKRRDIAAGLKSASGYIRRELANTLNLRVTPELSFHPDTSAEYGASIDRILKDINGEKIDE